jgi:hypothetical protein
MLTRLQCPLIIVRRASRSRRARGMFAPKWKTKVEFPDDARLRAARQKVLLAVRENMVGGAGFEPATPGL